MNKMKDRVKVPTRDIKPTVSIHSSCRLEATFSFRGILQSSQDEAQLSVEQAIVQVLATVDLACFHEVMNDDLLVTAGSKVALDTKEASPFFRHVGDCLVSQSSETIQESSCGNVAKVLSRNLLPAAICKLGLQSIVPEEMETMGNVGIQMQKTVEWSTAVVVDQICKAQIHVKHREGHAVRTSNQSRHHNFVLVNGCDLFVTDVMESLEKVLASAFGKVHLIKNG